MEALSYYSLLKDIYPSLKLVYTYGSGDKPYKVSALSGFRYAIRRLEQLPYFQQEIEAIKNSSVFATSTENVELSSTEHSVIEGMIKSTRTKIDLLFQMAESSVLFEREDLLYIKLPELNSFEELSKLSLDLKKGIEIPVVELEGERVEIVEASKGSVVLLVTVGSIAAVNLVGYICYSAAVLRKKRAEAGIHEAYHRSLELKNELIETLNAAAKEQLKRILDSEAEAIASKKFSHTDPETVGRLKLSITSVADLIEKGGVINAINSTEETQKLFPDYNALSIIESSIKQISGGDKTGTI